MLYKLGFTKRAKQKPYMSEGSKDIASGFMGGAAGTMAVFPLDTLTTRAQAKYLTQGKQVKGWAAVKRLLKGQPLKQTYKPASRMGRFLSLYKGMPFKLLKTVPGTAVTLSAYGFTKRQLDKRFTSNK